MHSRDFFGRRQTAHAGVRRSERSAFRQTGIVPVKNASGADRNRFDVLGIDAPLFTPTDNLTSFQNQIALVGVTPREADHYGKFAILLEPLRTGRIGKACVSGVCVVRLNVLDESHDFADVEDGCTENLKTGSALAATGGRITWRPSPKATAGASASPSSSPVPATSSRADSIPTTPAVRTRSPGCRPQQA